MQTHCNWCSLVFLVQSADQSHLQKERERNTSRMGVDMRDLSAASQIIQFYVSDCKIELWRALAFARQTSFVIIPDSTRFQKVQEWFSKETSWVWKQVCWPKVHGVDVRSGQTELEGGEVEKQAQFDLIWNMPWLNEVSGIPILWLVEKYFEVFSFPDQYYDKPKIRVDVSYLRVFAQVYLHFRREFEAWASKIFKHHRPKQARKLSHLKREASVLPKNHPTPHNMLPGIIELLKGGGSSC